MRLLECSKKCTYNLLSLFVLLSAFCFSNEVIAADRNSFGLGIIGGAIAGSDANFKPAAGAEIVLWNQWAAKHIMWGYKRADYTIYGSQTSFTYELNPTTAKEFFLGVGASSGRYLVKYSGSNGSAAEQSERWNVSLTTSLQYKIRFSAFYVSPQAVSHFTPAYGGLLLAFGHQLFGGIGLGAEF